MCNWTLLADTLRLTAAEDSDHHQTGHRQRQHESYTHPARNRSWAGPVVRLDGRIATVRHAIAIRIGVVVGTRTKERPRRS